MPDSAAGQVTRIVAIRHGETAWNVDTRIQGQLDIPLNDTGRWQAQRLAQALADEGIGAVYASDLLRALRDRAVGGARLRRRGGHRHRPARARLRRLRGPDLRRDRARWPERERTLAPARARLRPRPAARCCTDFYARCVACVSRAGRSAILAKRSPGRPWRRARLPVPRRHRGWTCGRRAPGSSATPASTGCCYTPQGLTLVGWTDTGHLDAAVLDEFSDAGVNRAALGSAA